MKTTSMLAFSLFPPFAKRLRIHGRSSTPPSPPLIPRPRCQHDFSFLDRSVPLSAITVYSPALPILPFHDPLLLHPPIASFISLVFPFPLFPIPDLSLPSISPLPPLFIPLFSLSFPFPSSPSLFHIPSPFSVVAVVSLASSARLARVT